MKLLFESWRKFLKEQREDLHIFFDMDGVLVDFAGKVAEEINKTLDADAGELYANSKSKRSALRRLQRAFKEEGRTEPVSADELESMTAIKDSGRERTKVQKRISDYLYTLISDDPRIWIEMGVLGGAKEMVELAQQLGNVYVLTSPVDDVSAGAKRRWIDTHFPNIDPDRVFVTKEKGAQLQSLEIVDKGERAVLIDDRAKYINQFEKAGGETIHHSPENVSKTINSLRGLAT